MASIGIQLNDSSLTQAEAKQRLQEQDSAGNSVQAVLVSNYFRRLAGGLANGTVKVEVSGTAAAKASGTLTVVSSVAGDTVVINGQTLTAVAGTPTANQFKVGVSDAADATSLANCIASTTTQTLITGVVTAAAVSNVVTVSALRDGKVGNSITISTTGGTITASGARLTGGTGLDAADITYSF